MSFILQPQDRVLFQGDSITDCGRRESRDGLGHGYVSIVAGTLRALHPEWRGEILNRGISGDRTPELLARWDADCLQLRPAVLSIKIGVNDVWRKLGSWSGQGHVELPDYQANIRELCNSARAAGVRQLILISPTTIAADNADPINQLLGEYAAWLQSYAAEIGALWVDARTPLLDARREQPSIDWTPDGCHPSIAGHALIAATWLRAVGAA